MPGPRPLCTGAVVAVRPAPPSSLGPPRAPLPGPESGLCLSLQAAECESGPRTLPAHVGCSMPFLGFEVQCQLCLGPQISPALRLASPSAALALYHSVRCKHLALPEHSIQSCGRKPREADATDGARQLLVTMNAFYNSNDVVDLQSYLFCTNLFVNSVIVFKRFYLFC